MASPARLCQPGLPPALAALKWEPMSEKKRQREERLGAALRENLRRRKARLRALAEQPEGKSDGESDRHDDP